MPAPEAQLHASRPLLALAAVAGAGIVALIVAAVVMRYAISSPFRFTEELAGLLLASMVFLSIPAVRLADSDIRVTLFTERLGGAARRLAWVTGQLITAGFFAVLAWEAWGIAAFTTRLGLMSEAARLPLSPFLWLMVAGAALTALVALVQAIRRPPPP